MATKQSLFRKEAAVNWWKNVLDYKTKIFIINSDTLKDVPLSEIYQMFKDSLK